MAAVELHDLGKSFPGMDQPALSAISGTISAGKVTGLVGPDGAGKTTLLRLMAGLMRAESGRLAVLDRDPATQAGELRLEVGYMPQKFGLYEDLTVIENLALHADLRDVSGAERDRATDE